MKDKQIYYTPWGPAPERGGVALACFPNVLLMNFSLGNWGHGPPKKFWSYLLECFRRFHIEKSASVSFAWTALQVCPLTGAGPSSRDPSPSPARDWEVFPPPSRGPLGPRLGLRNELFIYPVYI